MRKSILVRALALMMTLCMLPALMGAAPMPEEAFAPEEESVPAVPEAPVPPEEAPEEPAPETVPDMPETASLDPMPVDEPMAVDAAPAYYVVLSEGGTKLTFQTAAPETGTLNEDYWAMTGTEVFNYNSEGDWHQNGYKNSITEVVIADDITLNGEYLFYGFKKLETVSGKGKFTLTESAHAMFCDCEALTKLNVSEWETSNVTDMREMFSDCKALTELNVSKWKTSNVTRMSTMFLGCKQLKTLDFSEWDVSKVTTMDSMFSGAGLTELDLSGWTSTGEVHVVDMFNGCEALKSLNMAGWSAKVTGSAIFGGCTSLEELDISGWSSADMEDWYSGCTSLEVLKIGDGVVLGEYGADMPELSAATTNTWRKLLDDTEHWDNADTFIAHFGSSGHGGTYYRNRYPLVYDANGGTFDGGGDEIDEACSIDRDKIAKACKIGDDVKLMTALPTNKGGCVCVGWSKDQKAAYTEAPEDGVIITKVTMPSEGNAKVYAVWAVDANGNGTPDYEEPASPGPGSGGSSGGSSGWRPPAVDKTELKKAKDEAGGLDPEDYTDGTWPEVEKALEDAKKVYDDPTATQKEVDDATDVLHDAMGGLETRPEEKEPIQPPASGTGWVHDPETGDWYFFKDGHLVRDYWVGWSDGASSWVNIWYYVNSDGKLLTGFHYLDNLKGGKDWYMLQTTNDNGCIGRMLDGWQWTYTDAGEGWFNPVYGVQGRCEYTTAWGAYNAATGLWADGMAHIG